MLCSFEKSKDVWQSWKIKLHKEWAENYSLEPVILVIFHFSKFTTEFSITIFKQDLYSHNLVDTLGFWIKWTMKIFQNLTMNNYEF